MHFCLDHSFMTGLHAEKQQLQMKPVTLESRKGWKKMSQILVLSNRDCTVLLPRRIQSLLYNLKTKNQNIKSI